ncbi:MAG TPA: response regulator, partial [Caulobacter sp.]|nr:response regulator [Caulobacter sp.]
FTAAGGITARLAVERSDGADELVVEISDTGIGIAVEQLDRLFQRFSQADGSIRRSFGGAGLGLAICKALVTLMDGQIGVRSVAGQGSTFWVRLPAAAAKPMASAKTSAVPGPVARILLVDDHPMNRELGKALLVLAGCDVQTADDGDEAVRAAAMGDFDLILMDIHMPRMDGLAASQAIRALSGPASAVPIIALSADVMPQQIERCREAGMVDHVAKPIDRAALYAAINRCLAPDPLAA